MGIKDSWLGAFDLLVIRLPTDLEMEKEKTNLKMYV